MKIEKDRNVFGGLPKKTTVNGEKNKKRS